MLWWKDPKLKSKNGIIADGSIRSGKTISMTIGFVLWAMTTFEDSNFAICGKTIEALRRNVIKNIPVWLGGLCHCTEKRTENLLIIRIGSRVNSFYLFGGRDESSYQLIQGITLAGVLFDEVALMPRSFVEQALGRCSVEGSKFWFNCNPEHPQHWFYKEWVQKPDEKNILHLHFTMADNPSLSEEIKQRYYNMYTGTFFKRYILGLWAMAEGLIYDMFSHTENIYTPDREPVDLKWTGRRYIAVDYGTTNPTRFLDIYDYKGTIYIAQEYNWDSRKELRQKTDSEYAEDFLRFITNSNTPIMTTYIDPSAASFIAELEARGVFVTQADNEVLDGIRKTATLIKRRLIKINISCEAIIEEMSTYSWDDKAAARGEEKPIKQADHSLDALRYYVNSLPDWRFE